MQNDSISESLTYVSDDPDITSLRYAYDQSVTELEAYFDLCRSSYDDRRNWWPGKSRDLRKHGARVSVARTPLGALHLRKALQGAAKTSKTYL